MLAEARRQVPSPARPSWLASDPVAEVCDDAVQADRQRGQGDQADSVGAQLGAPSTRTAAPRDMIFCSRTQYPSSRVGLLTFEWNCTWAPPSESPTTA